MSIVKENLKKPILFMLVGLISLFYVNVGNINLLRNIFDLIFVGFDFSVLKSGIFELGRIAVIALLIIFCLKKLEESSSLITNDEDKPLSKIEDLLRRRYYYAHKTWGYLFFYIGWLGVIASLIGNTYLIFVHSNSIIFTIIITLIITIPLEWFVIKMLNRNILYVKKIMACYK